MNSQWTPCPPESSMDMDTDVSQARAVVKPIVEMDGGMSTAGLHAGSTHNPAEFADVGCGNGSWQVVSDDGFGLPRFVEHKRSQRYRRRYQ